ncbi:heme peroxidase [Pseudovirgaria hyperparasitica]|uniref:Peroxidase n=1 Tax=Pseudovirgaria hyperparasitica TaxID=470096 RepID=A0A6A6WG17_9PEZI|nr:heme peroxidase [Pseudovirgaria hyperparasitica]KAF2760980.1 heme peroxidase [Pseudovirgaria hyperparasitica]
MHFSKVVLFSAFVTFFPFVYAWPAMASSASDLTRRLIELEKSRTMLTRPNMRVRHMVRKRNPQADDDENGEEEEEEEEDPTHNEDDDPNDDDGTPVLIGDLLRDGARTETGNAIAGILLKTTSGQSTVPLYTPPGALDSPACQQDTCCVWSYISTAMTTAFTGPTGRCNALARAAIRLGFHDAATWSQTGALAGQDYGGADGSIVLSGTELSRPENNGLQRIGAQMAAWKAEFGVGMADLIQFGAIHAAVTCPLGPRLRFFVGRQDSSTPAADGLLPDVHASADSLIELFANKTIVPHDLAALLGAHTTSTQLLVDASHAGQGQDSTPGVWDVRYYGETLAAQAPDGVTRFHSDEVLSVHPKMSSEWSSFTFSDGQDHWNEDYAQSYTRMSMLGVNVMNGMVECSGVVPEAQRVFEGSEQPGVLE